MERTATRLIDTIRLSPRDRKRLVDELNRQAQPVPAASERRHLRVSYNIGQVEVRIAHPEGDPITYSVVPRNLSERGVAFLHGSFVYTGSQCTVVLPRLNAKPTVIAGRIHRCRHVTGLLHEVTVLFAQELNLNEFIRLSPDLASQCQKVNHDTRNEMIAIAVMDEQGNPSKSTVKPSELTAQGLSFAHGRSIASDTPCLVGLSRPDGKPVRITGRVTDCQPRRDGMHDITVRFEEPIDAATLGAVQPNSGETSALDEQTMRSRVLVVDDSPSDRNLLKLRLTKLGMVVAVADSAAQAMQVVGESAQDIVLMNMRMEDDAEVVKSLREAGYRGAMVAMSSDERPEVAAEATKRGFSAFLPKPLDMDLFRQVIRQMASFDTTDPHLPGFAKIHSVLAEDPDMKPLIEEYVGTLGKSAQEIEAACRAGDFANLARLCRELKGTGAGYGFDAITRYAMTAAQSAQDAADVRAIKRSVDDLVAILHRAAV